MYNLLRFFSSTPIDTGDLPQVKADAAEFAKIMTIVFSIAGSVALLVIVIGGFRYIISRGDPSGTAQAKNTIIYGIIGLVVVMASASIVALVINAV